MGKELRGDVDGRVSLDEDTGVYEEGQNYFALSGRHLCHSSTMGAATKTDE